MPLTYRQVSDLYDAAPRQQSFPDWAANMDQLVGEGSTTYSDAAHDPYKVKAVSTGIDKLLEATGLPSVTEKVGGAVGSLVGNEEAGARIGHGLPRAAVNFAPLLALEVGTAGASTPLTVAALGATGALSGAETYTETGSPTAGVVSGATNVIMPGVASAAEKYAGQAALKAFGGRLVKGDVIDEAGRIANVGQYFPTTTAQKVGAGAIGYGASQVAAAGVGEAGTVAQEKLTGQPLSNPFSTDNLLNLTLGQAPFALIHATRSVMGGSGKTPMQQADLLQLAIDKSEPAILAHQAEQERRNQPDVGVIAPVTQTETTPEINAQIEATLARVRGRQLEIKNDPNLSEPDRINQLNAELERESQLLQKKAPTPQAVFGNTIVPDQPRQELVGRQVWVNALGTHRRILVAEDPANPPELWNHVIGYSTKDEPAPKFGLGTLETQVGGGPNTGLGVFSLPDQQWRATPKPAYEYFANQKSPETKRTAEQVKAEGSTIDPVVEPLVKALNGKNVITTGSDERSVQVENAHVDESKLPPNWRYDPDTGTITKAATVTDQGPVRPEEIQPIVNAVTPFPRKKITVGQAEGQPDLPVAEEPMTDSELQAHLHEIDKVIVAASAAQTPLDGQLAVVDLQNEQAGHDLPITDDTTLKPIMESIADKDVIDPNKVPQAAVVVAANLTKAQLKAKQKALNDLLSSQARGEEAPVSFADLPGKAEQAEIARVTELMGGGGEGAAEFSVRKLGNLNKMAESETHIMTDELANIALEEVSKGTDAMKVFKKWNIDEDGEEKSSFKKDAKDFFDIVNNFKDLAHLPYEKVAEFLNARNSTSGWDEYEVRSFMIRPHVEMWLKAMDDNVGKKFEANAARIAAHNPSPPGIPAGGGFIFGLKPTEQIQGLPKTGVLPETKFQNVASHSGAFSKGEMELMRSLVPEAFQKGQVDVNKLQEGLKTKGPVVEVKTLKNKVEDRRAGFTPDEVQADNVGRQAQHELETAGFTMLDDNGWHLLGPADEPIDIQTQPQHIQDAFARYVDAAETVPPGWDELGANRPQPPGSTHYQWLGPKDEQQMPGYVEGLVRLPVEKKSPEFIKQQHEKFPHLWDAQGNPVPGRPEGIRGDSVNDYFARYTGPHFGAEDKNVLSFYRGYEETLPNGEKAFHVFELQSDWGQSQRDRQEQLKERLAKISVSEPLAGDNYWTLNTADNGHLDYDTKEQAEAAKQKLIEQEHEARDRAGHPLLEAYNGLALKAAIQHAKEVGATKLIVSDAPTAMMTEGHDRSTLGPEFDITLPDLQKRAEEYFGGKLTPKQTSYNTIDFRDAGGETQFSVNFDPVTDRPTIQGWADPTGSARIVRFDTDQRITPEKLGLKPVEPSEANISQAKGMRLHYDQILPSAMEKLTKDKGQVVDLGVHKATQRNMEPDEGSPVFKNPDGTPKTNVTGRMYDLAQTPEAFTLMGKSRTQDVASGPRWLSEPDYTPQTSSEIHYATEFGLDENGRGDGHGIVNYLKNHDEAFYRALGLDLQKLGPDSLSRVIVQLKQAEGSYLRQNQNGTSEITLAANVLNGSSETHANTLAHELIHGLTANEMDNPLKQGIVQELDKLRDRLINKLSPDLRDAYEQLMEQNWYARYANNEVGPDMNDVLKIGDLTNGEQGILYGLMSTKEMVAQGISNKDFQLHMMKIQAPQGKTVFARMANFIKQILNVGGKVKDTEFEQFLAHTDQLIESGNYVSSFKNFTDKYFERLGQTGNQVDINTDRAMGLINDSVFGSDPASLLFQIRMGAMVSSPEVFKASNAWDQEVRTQSDDFKRAASIITEMGYQGADGIHSMIDDMLLGEVKDHGDVLDTLPPAAANYIFAYARDAKMILGSIQEATMKANAGLLNIADPKLISGPVAESLKLVDNVLKYEKEHQVAQQNVDSLEGIPPSGFATNVVQNPEILPSWAMGTDKTKDKEAFLHTFLEPIAQWARRIPEVAEVVSKGWQLAANSRKMATEALKAFGTDLQTMSMSKASVKLMEKMLGNSKLTRAVDQWIYTNQKVGQEKESVQMLDANHPDIEKILAPLSQSERDQAEELVQKHQISQQQMQAQILEKQLQIASTRGAELTGLPLRQGVRLSSTLIEALRADRSNPVAAASADAQISTVQAGMQPEQFLNLLKFSEAAVNEWKAVQDFYQKNPAWSSGQRYGKFLVSYTRGKKPYLAGVDSEKEAKKLTEGATNIVFKKNQKSEGDAPPNLGPDSIGMVQKLREFQQTQYDMMLNSGKFTQDDIAFMKQTSPTEQFITEEAYRGGVPGLRPEARGLTRGAEELPWLRNHFSWVKKTATYQSRQLLRAQVHAHLLDPEIAANPELQKKLQTHFDNMLQPDTQIGHTFQRAAMNWFMGFNPASALVNATQPFLTHTAEFTAMTGKPVDSYRRTIGALNDIRKYFQSGKKSWGDPDLDWAMHKATQDGEIDLAMFDDDPATQETIHTNFKRIMDGNKSQTLGQRLGTMAGSWSNAGMWMFRGVERFNTQAAILSSFKYYTEQGLGREQALEKAYQFNHAVNYGGGAAGRPVGIFSGRGAVPRTAAMLSTSMQSYVLGTTYQLARYIQKGFFRPAGLAPAEVYSARKAAVQMLGVQLASAGVLGMPFVSGAVAVLNQLFPDLEVRKHLQEWMNDLLGSDKENGSILSDAAMMGVPSMFGWDLQSRLSMGNTLPGVSEVNGFDPSTLLGAPINLVSTFVKGGKQLAQGDVTGIDQFVPPALKKIEQYARQGGIATDYRDRPVFTPTKGEVAGMALGFQPRRTTDFNTASRIAKQAQDNITRRSGEFHQQMGEQVLKGNFGNVRGELQKRMREDPKFDPASAVRSIAQSAEDLTFPRDLRREGTIPASDVRARLLRTFNIPPSQADESTRLQFRQGVERRLGLQVSTGSDLRLAQVMDQLRRQSPEATRSDLRRQAEHLLRSPRPQTFASPQE